MLVNQKYFRTIWLKESDDRIIQIIDQQFLPYQFIIRDLGTVKDFEVAIRDMQVRGAGLIGATAGYGMYVAAMEASEKEDFDSFLMDAAHKLKATRPTAVNLEWAVNRQMKAISEVHTIEDKIQIAKITAREIADEDAEFCRNIGLHGVKFIESISKRKQGEVVNILTHCNAGWLAFVDYGTATAPIYEAFNRGIKIHVWVDETRPRNQGASLTAWELLNQRIPHTIIADNTGGHLMQKGMVDMVITGADRVTRTGDVANKIGTYLKALAAKDNKVPFYVAIPSSTFDWAIRNGLEEIPIETRDPDEVRYIQGLSGGELTKVLIAPDESPAANYGFDVTPSRLVSGLITERGFCPATEEGILSLYPERK
ncbi:MAG TPA: S-methyl-5-thioribose-1-phosphate isomerase [Bacteroidales bacterium]